MALALSLPSSRPPSFFTQHPPPSAGVKSLPVSSLNELLEEMEGAIREFSEELVQQLALRDELEFEKEVKNSFISVLIEVQKKQKEHRESARKKKQQPRDGGTLNGRHERGHAPGTVSQGLGSWAGGRDCQGLGSLSCLRPRPCREVSFLGEGGRMVF